MTLPSGTRLGPYEIRAPLGAGGMGEVYRARDIRLDRDVAVKVLSELLAVDPDALTRFEREAKAVAALSHPNILAIHDVGNQGGVHYAVTELLEGRTLRELLDGGAIGPRKAIESLLGEKDEALRWLTDAAHNGFPCYRFFENDPLLESVRGEDRFRKLMSELREECAGYGRLYDELRRSPSSASATSS